MEIITLGWEDDIKVKAILNQALAMVKPILKQKSWTIGIVREFYPADASLLGLNLNHGQEISIRCRKSNNKRDFYDFDHILGTLLHEMVHIVHGPHDETFDKLLNELYEQVENGSPLTIIDCGHKLNLEKKNPPRHLVRNLAVVAAEKRAKHESLMGSGKSGGSHLARNDPREAVRLATILRYSKQ